MNRAEKVGVSDDLIGVKFTRMLEYVFRHAFVFKVTDCK